MNIVKPHIYPLTVQFEDIDAGGVVHHPTYLKYYERARSAALSDFGFPFDEMLKAGVAVAVAEVYLSYKKPLRMYEQANVISIVAGIKRSNIRFYQGIVLGSVDSKSLEEATAGLEGLLGLVHLMEARLVCVDLKEMRPVSLPERLIKAFGLPPEAEWPESFREVRIKTDGYK